MTNSTDVIWKPSLDPESKESLELAASHVAAAQAHFTKVCHGLPHTAAAAPHADALVDIQDALRKVSRIVEKL